MHVGGITVDLNWLLQFIFTVFVIGLGLLHLVKNTASKYFEVGANFEAAESSHTAIDPNIINQAVEAEEDSSICGNCGGFGTKKCSRCKSVRYCSQRCQEADWKAGHKLKCKDFKLNSSQTVRSNFGFKPSGGGSRSFSNAALVPTNGVSNSKPIKKPGKVLFPYDEFIKLYNSDKPEFSPCGLLNCGNSCFANVVLQCLTYTRPLVAYLLKKGHQTECRHNDWCFLCEFQSHVERASQSTLPFSPINILSRLPNIGGNLGYGRQEDAHEFMRLAIDTMQSVCLDEFGGEKAVEPASQETTIIQHIFGGRLQSQVICTRCNKISNQFENMMDLTVEIHGDAASLEECLDQFTDKEWLHGENLYKCDRCNDYVKAWKRLTIQRAPNVLTIALKRFQSGRFGKLNKRVTFPEMLDLSPYMSEGGDGTDVYKLYAVVVHVDMLNASFFGHYICYTKDFHGNWHRIDDCKVSSVELDEVLSQGAYMLVYSRVSVRPSCLRTIEPSKEQQSIVKVELDSCTENPVEHLSPIESMDATNSGFPAPENENSEVGSEHHESGTGNEDPDDMIGVDYCSSLSIPVGVSGLKKDSAAALDSEAVVIEHSLDYTDTVMSESDSAVAKDIKVNGSIYSFSSEEIST
ncbi:ubiquitin carboxyl-terminal hydrolase 18-like [Populus alba x Populus x berolinensis]|nr:ubiquitin carboxyl-terminal hydrolase 18-like [Populus alba x Populus x berolinensis]